MLKNKLCYFIFLSIIGTAGVKRNRRPDRITVIGAGNLEIRGKFPFDALTYSVNLAKTKRVYSSYAVVRRKSACDRRRNGE